jgi:hypothetical protein
LKLTKIIDLILFFTGKKKLKKQACEDETAKIAIRKHQNCLAVTKYYKKDPVIITYYNILNLFSFYLKLINSNIDYIL